MLKTIPRMILHTLIRLVHGKKWDQRIDKKINSYLEKYTNKDDRFIGVPVWELRFEPFEKDLFVGRKRVAFENINVWIPEKSDIILKKMYGNYMELPPISEQEPHHGYKVYRRN